MDNLLNALSYPLSFAIVIITLVFFHELGHFLIARWCGVKVLVFAIGLGPKVWGFVDRQGTSWQLSLLPLGGYVKMLGGEAVLDPDALQKIPPKERKYAFPCKSLAQRAAIVIAGPLANVLLSLVIFTAVFSLYGRYQPTIYLESGFSEIQNDSPAQKAGLIKGDIITQFGEIQINKFEDLSKAISKYKDLQTSITVSREGSYFNAQITPRKIVNDGKTLYQIGVMSPRGKLVRDSIPSAFINSIHTSYQITSLIGNTLKNLLFSSFLPTTPSDGQSTVSSSSSPEFAGPLGIASMSRDALFGGIIVLAMTIAIWSINLAIFNMLPIPVLDGGHLLLFLIEAIIKKPINHKIQQYVTTFGVLLLMSLFVYVTYGDIVRILTS